MAMAEGASEDSRPCASTCVSESSQPFRPIYCHRGKLIASTPAGLTEEGVLPGGGASIPHHSMSFGHYHVTFGAFREQRAPWTLTPAPRLGHSPAAGGFAPLANMEQLATHKPHSTLLGLIEL
jgi:hypothetical protein